MVQIFGILVAEIIIGVLCVCLTLYWSANLMSDALARLTASVAAIGADVSGIANAIRNHINSDSGISQTALNALADQLDDAGAKLKGLETDLGAPPIEQPAPQPDLAPTGDVPPAGNQNGIGSEFEDGTPPASDVPPALDWINTPPASDDTPIE